MSDQQKQSGNIKTKTILAGKHVKEFSLKQPFTLLAFIDTKFPWFAEDLFMRYCPGYTGNRQGKNKKPYYLFI